MGFLGPQSQNPPKVDFTKLRKIMLFIEAYFFVENKVNKGKQNKKNFWS